MVGSITHKYVSAIADSADTGLVRPSNWNDEHDITGLVPYTGATENIDIGTFDFTTTGDISGAWTGTIISTTYGGTGISTYTTGDILYASATNTLSKLAGNTSTTTKFLSQTGDGVNSAAPIWTSTIHGGTP